MENVTCHLSGGNPAAGCRRPAVIDFYCCLKRRSDDFHAFQWARQPAKLPLHFGRSGRPSNTHVSLGPPDTTPQTASRSVQPFFMAHERSQRNRPTSRPRYCVCRNRPLSHTGWAKKVIPLVQCNICTRGITFLAQLVAIAAMRLKKPPGVNFSCYKPNHACETAKSIIKIRGAEPRGPGVS